MDRDYQRSKERIERSEERREERLGAGMTRQVLALARPYIAPLAEWIGNDLSDRRRSRRVRQALRPLGNETIGLKLFIAGISVAWGKHFGVNARGQKTYVDTCKWIGATFGERNEVGFKLGDWGIKALCSQRRFRLVDDRLCVVITDDDVDQLFKDVIEGAARHHPLLSPLDSPPGPWTSFWRDDFSPDGRAVIQLVRGHHPSTENIVRHAIGKRTMQPALDALDYLGSVPLIVDRQILDLVKRYGPPPVPDQRLLKKKDKKSKQRVSEMDAVRGAWNLDMRLAGVAAELDRCWVPSTFDFRGRLNPICTLSFVREDRVRSIFRFADGEPINDDGVAWLKQFVARMADGNSFSDESKPSRLNLAQRINWTERHIEHICSIGRSVISGEKPSLDGIGDRFQFASASACAELVQALDQGPRFISRLPIQFDASCSGLQHLCSMARANEGKYVYICPPPQDHYVDDGSGNLVNLGPDQSLDIYTLVQTEAGLEYPDLEHILPPLDRKIAKTPVMTRLYGVGRRKMSEQINDALLEPTERADDAAVAIRATIDRVAPKAMEVFKWLQELAAICAKHNVPMRWDTPLGFPVVCNYYPSIVKEVKTPTKKPGRFRNTNLAIGYRDKIHPGDAITSICANFVHSADACHLHMIALACAAENIPLLSIHDCFATTANHAGRLNEIIRETFVAMYENHDWLTGLWQSVRDDLPKAVDLPPVPKPSNLNIRDVLTNFFAFC